MGASILIQGTKEQCEQELENYKAMFKIVSVSECPIYDGSTADNKWLMYIYYDEKEEE